MKDFVVIIGHHGAEGADAATPQRHPPEALKAYQPNGHAIKYLGAVPPRPFDKVKFGTVSSHSESSCCSGNHRAVSNLMTCYQVRPNAVESYKGAVVRVDGRQLPEKAMPLVMRAFRLHVDVANMVKLHSSTT